MKAIFLTDLAFEKNEGIYKKMLAEAKALNDILGECKFIKGASNGATCIDITADSETNVDVSPLDCAMERLKKGETEFLYVRHMVPNIKLLKLLSYAHNHNIKIYYEIPTYPFFAEQFRVSRKKYRAIAKIALNIIFDPFIYHFVDRVVVIKSSTKVHMFKKMIESNNGSRTDNIKIKTESVKKDNTIRLVAVGTLAPYHGYDRLLYGLKECEETVDGKAVEFHIVGKSSTTDDLKELANNLNLKNVVFHGVKTTEELNEMYENFDIGIGCLALHRRNADIDTTLKVIEYFCRGVPVVSSGRLPVGEKYKDCTISVPDGEEAIDIKKMCNDYENIDMKKIRKLAEESRVKFSWEYTMRKILTSGGILS